jgi:integrase
VTAEYLLDKELEHVYAALMPANALVCKVAAETGLRIGDVLSLRTEDLKPQMWITEHKTGKRRRINFRKATLDAMRKSAGEQWVFESPMDASKHRTRQAIWKDVRRAAVAFRLPQHVSPHSLRKKWAVEQYHKHGGDLQAVQKAMCHSSPAITMIYAMADQLYQSKYGQKK